MSRWLPVFCVLFLCGCASEKRLGESFVNPVGTAAVGTSTCSTMLRARPPAWKAAFVEPLATQ